jgi:hypothetical protein
MKLRRIMQLLGATNKFWYRNDVIPTLHPFTEHYEETADGNLICSTG